MPPQRLPQTLDWVQLRAIAGQPLEFQVWVRRQRLIDVLARVLRRVVDQQHHLLVLVLWVDPPDRPQVVGKRLLQRPRLALARLLLDVLGALQRVAMHRCVEQVDHGEDVQQILVVARPRRRPVSLDPQRRHQGRHHRQTPLVLA